MRRIRLSPAAEADITEILSWSQKTFGDAARRKYEALVVQAIVDVAADCARAGVHDRSDIVAWLLSYHISNARSRVPGRERRVVSPRHVLLFRIRGEAVVEIIRVLHDSMDTERHLPPLE